MRNLKRALSLTLASVMLLGMMVVGSSAASFKDADQISNDTAATVLQELDIMVGDNNGYFMPEKTVTRGEMAVIVCKILYGDKLNVTQFVDGSKFTDVPASHYANGYVNLANQLGIIAGYGNGKFGPDDTITTAQAAVMLCKALGYFKGSELTGDWANDSLKAVATATSLKLFDGLRLATHEGLARDNVAQMTFNTISKAVPVQYNEFFQSYYTDQDSVLSGVVFHYQDTLGYKNFSLVYDPTSTNDDFGRPVIEWGIGTCTGTNVDKEPEGVVIKNSIIKVADEALLTYTKDVKAKDIFADLGKPSNLTNDSKAEVITNGNNANAGVTELPLNNTTETKVGAKGSTVEVYKDSDNKVTIVVTDTYLVRATADYNTKDEKLSVVVPGGTVTLSDSKISNDDVDVSSFKKDDLILVTGVIESGKLVIKTAELAPVVENVKISASNDNDYVTAGGTKYEYSAHEGYYKDVTKNNYTLQKTGYNIVLDKAGYVLGIEKYSDEVTLDDILFVKDAGNTAFGVDAKVLFMDGTEKTVSIAATAKIGDSDYTDTSSNSKVETETVNTPAGNTSLELDTAGNVQIGRFYEFNEKSDGEYELKDINRQGKAAASGNDANKNIDGGSVKPVINTTTPVNKSATGETIFIAKDQRYVGIANAPDVYNSAVYYLFGADSDASYLQAVYSRKDGVSVTSTSDYVYILEAKGSGKDDNDKSFKSYTAIKDGSKETDYRASTSDTITPGLYEIKTERDGYPELKLANKVDTTTTTGDVMRTATGVDSGDISYKSGTITAGSFGLKVNSDTLVYVVDVADRSASSMDASGVDGIDVGTYDVYAIFNSKSDDTVKVLWLAKTSSSPTLSGGSISASDITEKLESGETVVVKGTVSESVTLTTGTVELGTGSSIDSSNTITVKSDATVNITDNVAGAGSIKLDGGTINVSAGVTDLPAIDNTSKGTITIANEGSVRVDGADESDPFGLNALGALVGDVDLGDSSASDSTTTYTINLATGNRNLAFKGEGNLLSYSSVLSIARLNSLFGSTSVSFGVFDLKDKISEGDTVVIEFWKDSTKVDGLTETGIYGTGSTGTEVSEDDAKDGEIVLPYGDTVTKIVIKITSNDDEGDGG